MSLVWDKGPEGHIDRYVLLAIADNANDEGFAHPSITTIAIKTCLSTRTVMRSIQTLESGGWLVAHRKSRDVKFSTYTISLSRFHESGDSQSHDRRSRDSHDTSQVTPSQKSGDSQSRYIEEPSVNHQLKPSAKTVCAKFAEKCFHHYPKQTSPKSAVESFSGAIRELRDAGRFDSLTASGEWLLARVKAYASSPYVRSQMSARYLPKAAKWVADGVYDEKDEDWIANQSAPVIANFSDERSQMIRILHT